jgi:flagellar biosynthesis/type III secretory pathway chaperone
MRQSLTDLCELLLQQKKAIENMLELSKEERQIIVKGESDKLESVIRLELRELSALGAVEKKRMELHKVIAQELGLNESELTVSLIAERAESDEREVIRKIQKELTGLIAEHTTLNMENRELIKAHVEYSETMLELMVGSEDPLNNFYGGDGKSAPDRIKTTSFFDGHA